MAYTLYFSDPRKTSTISVPGTGTGPGKNNYDTSLELVGPGYVNYGTAIAQNFLKLLENFSGPNPPQNPIEGQLWYDTGSSDRKILRVHNSSPTSKGWPTASGIYQQANDPSLGTNSADRITSIKDGDLWVNLATGQLNLRSGGQWVVVGPTTITGAEKTGLEVTKVTSSLGTIYPIIQKYVGGEVVEIISFNEFTPRTVINGFGTIKPGSNLTSRNNARYNGTADRASALEVSRGIVIQATDILKNRAVSQIHTGTLIIESSNGIRVKYPSSDYFIQLSNTSQEGLLNFNNPSSTFKLGINLDSYIKFNGQHKNIGINTSTSSTSPTLDVNGSGRFKGVLSAYAVNITGNEIVEGKLSVLGNVLLSSLTTASNKLTLGNGNLASRGTILEPARDDVYDIGSPTRKFKQIYATIIGHSTATIKGTLDGPAKRLESTRQFIIKGQIKETRSYFDGSSDVTFVTELDPSSISAQRSTTSTVATQTLLILNTATTTPVLEKISKKTFLSDVYPRLLNSGTIVPTGISNPSFMPGFLLCDGTAYSQVTYSSLFGAISTTYGSSGPGTFKVPDLRNITASVSGAPLYYYIKI